MFGVVGAYWVAAIALTLVKELVAPLRRLAAYGGRRLPEDGQRLRYIGLAELQLSRRTVFASFYVAGLLTSIVSCVAWETPLDVAQLAVMTHCGVRLGESLWVHRFRSSDTVSLFAMVAGCSFYVAWPLSFDGANSGTSCNGCIVAAALFAAVQIVQIWHHSILRQQRGSSSTTYRLPTAGLFAVIQEPHYALEVTLHLIISGFHYRCAGDWMVFLPAVFTTINLCLTAKTRRAFWMINNCAVPKWLVVPFIF